MILRHTMVLLVLSAVGADALAQSASLPPPSPVSTSQSVGDQAFGDPGPADGSGRGDGRIWVEAEYLLWWMRAGQLPTLLTTSPPGTPISQAGILGAGGTPVQFGDSKSSGDARSGARITAGGWFTEDRSLGIEASYFALEGKAPTFPAASNGSTILARPFIDATTGLPSAQVVAFPGTVSGNFLAIDASSGLTSTGVLLRENCWREANWQLDVLAGYRYLRLTDRIGISDNIVSLSTTNPFNIAPGTQLAVGDAFGTRNLFNGYDTGLDFQYCYGPFSLNLLGKLAVGYNDQTVDIVGNTKVTVPGAGSVVNSAGLLALSSNMGHFGRNSEVSVIPEVDVKLGYQVSQRVRATIGYTMLYWSNVVRAGDQIDTTVNPNLLPPTSSAIGPARPAFAFQRTSLLTQGFNLGLEFRY